MSKLTVYFARMSVLYLGAGASLGALMVIWPELRLQGYTAHAHINLLGWVSMMIYGVSYHVFPRFSGRNMVSETMGWVHFWFVNIGLVGLVAGFFLDATLGETAIVGIKALSGGLVLAGIFMFIVNIWPCLTSLEVTPCAGK